MLTLLLDLNANTKAGAGLAPGVGPVFTGIDNTGNVNNVTLNSSGLAYTTDQVRTAYGINSLALDGTGQVIAIVDAYDDPAIFAGRRSVRPADVNRQRRSLAVQPVRLRLVVPHRHRPGRHNHDLPAVDPTGGWETEAALDVEWAHAMAPGAQIILVEANSQSLADLMASVGTAARQPGVSVVSMSWGFTEGQSVLAQDEAMYDQYLTTPAGSTGVTFVASTGDYGTADPEYPAFSPNVVAVGGTSLYLNSDNSYNSETGWGYYSNGMGAFIGGGGGASQFEAEPAYQLDVQSTGMRTTPDVSFMADPGTGAWIADPYNLGSDNPWEVVGGTSLSAPSWAGLLALANQGRANSGETPLGSPSDPTATQEALYGVPQTDYNAVTTGSNGYSAGAGYNLVTGLGTPNASLLIPDLIAYNGVNNSGSTVTITSAPAPSVTAGNGITNVVNVFDALVVGNRGSFGGSLELGPSTAPSSVPLSLSARALTTDAIFVRTDSSASTLSQGTVASLFSLGAPGVSLDTLSADRFMAAIGTGAPASASGAHDLGLQAFLQDRGWSNRDDARALIPNGQSDGASEANPTGPDGTLDAPIVTPDSDGDGQLPEGLILDGDDGASD